MIKVAFVSFCCLSLNAQLVPVRPPSSGSDITANLIATVAACRAGADVGCEMLLPRGTWTFTGLDTTSDSSPIGIIGCGSGNEANNTAPCTLSYTGTGTALNLTKGRLAHFRLQTSTGVTGIKQNGCNDQCGAEDLVITGFSGVGFSYSNGFNTTIQNVRSNGNGVGFYLNGNRINLSGSAAGDTTAGIQLDNCVVVNIVGNSIESNRGPGITLINAGSKAVNILDNYFESNGHRGPYNADVEFISPLSCTGCTVRGNYFNPAASGTAYAIYASGTHGGEYGPNVYAYGYTANATFPNYQEGNTWTDLYQGLNPSVGNRSGLQSSVIITSAGNLTETLGAVGGTGSSHVLQVISGSAQSGAVVQWGGFLTGYLGFLYKDGSFQHK